MRRTTFLTKASKQVAVINEASNQLMDMLQKLTEQEIQEQRQIAKPVHSSWVDKAPVDRVLTWLEKSCDGAAGIHEVKAKFNLTERQWLKLRKALEQSGCIVSGFTNQRTVRLP